MSTKKFILYAILAIFAFAALDLALGWGLLPFEKASVVNVEKQFTWGYTQMGALETTARSVCTAQKAYDMETDKDYKAQRLSQLTGYQSNYNRLQGEYDAWAANIFTGKVVRPSDLPERAPNLDQMTAKLCPLSTPTPAP